ncbi:cytochrome c(L), periplasmic [Hyphomicrobium sp. MC1]|uniref:cytochrome c(L), periplasmic n=1 Tax=Hyphomicrobium sp. (strain MC1) TaxID=717785 RepID=UPI000213F77C|nr:cytochrome c(L), periplasmic [Hyphomicrobium sp. MC1]CCB63721.1 Cytochrome c-L precursor [Hyphomicrobium sp. MC1]
MRFGILAAGAVVWSLIAGAQMANAQQVFQNTITGETLDVDGTAPKEGRNTPAVKKFLETGVDAYVEVTGCLPKGEEVFLESCSGCHGHIGEGKVGPGLNDSYWTYPKNETDKGLFETIFGGANGMMGPHGQDIELDDMLKLIAWIRHIQKDDVKDAQWLTDEQKKNFKAFNIDEWEKTGRTAAAKQQCKISGN